MLHQTHRKFCHFYATIVTLHESLITDAGWGCLCAGIVKRKIRDKGPFYYEKKKMFR